MHSDLAPDEQDLLGEWDFDGSTVHGNEAASRIHWLITERLERVTGGGMGWEVLYRDPRDGRYWELTYPQAEMHGGGPPRLTLLAPAAARDKYRLAAG